MHDAMRKITDLEREVADLRRMLAGVPSRVARPAAAYTWPRLRSYATTSQSLTIEAPINLAIIVAIGGGGGGGGGAELFGGGGGGGAMATVATVPVTSGGIAVTVSIGAGGGGGTGSVSTPSSVAGSAGGTTTVTGPDSAWFISALGGSGGGASTIEGGLGGRYTSGTIWGGVPILQQGKIEVYRGTDGQAGFPFSDGLLGTELGGYGGQPFFPAWLGTSNFGELGGVTTAVYAGAGGRGGAAEGNGSAGSSGCVLVYY